MQQALDKLALTVYQNEDYFNYTYNQFVLNASGEDIQKAPWPLWVLAMCTAEEKMGKRFTAEEIKTIVKFYEYLAFNLDEAKYMYYTYCKNAGIIEKCDFNSAKFIGFTLTNYK
jgi:hypothetical protein